MLLVQRNSTFKLGNQWFNLAFRIAHILLPVQNLCVQSVLIWPGCYNAVHIRRLFLRSIFLPMLYAMRTRYISPIYGDQDYQVEFQVM